MQTVDEVMAELARLGSAATRRIYARHGAPPEMFGVKIGDLKTVAKKIKRRQDLALQLYATGNADAMYLAGIVADGAEMTRKQLDDWARQASWSMVAEYTVPGVAAHHPQGRAVALKWIDSKKPLVAAAGWATYSALMGVLPDEALDLAEIRGLLQRVTRSIDEAPPRVQMAMNQFVIATGCFVRGLTTAAKAAARKIGRREIDLGETACCAPVATEYIAKVEAAGRMGRKRKSAKC